MESKIQPQWCEQALGHHQQFSTRCWWASDEVQGEHLNASTLDALIDAGDVLKHDRTTTVAKASLEGRAVIVKRYNARNQWHRLNRSVRRSRASRSWRLSYKFAKAGLNVAQPLIMLEQRASLLRRTAYFVSEFLPGDEVIELLPSLATSQQADLAATLKVAFQQMSDAKLSHGDLKASNLIWNEGRLFFIDLDAAQQHKNQLSWRMAHAKDRARFLKNWQGDQELLSVFEALELD